MDDFTRGEQAVAKPVIDIDQEYKYGFKDPEAYVFKSGKGLTRELVVEISEMKGEPGWMTDFRLKALETFFKKPMPTWGADLSGVDLDNIHYYVRPAERKGRTWDEVPEYIKETFDRLHSRPSKSSCRRVGAVRVRSGLPQHAEIWPTGRHLPGHGLGSGAPGHRQSTSAPWCRPATTSSRAELGGVERRLFIYVPPA